MTAPYKIALAAGGLLLLIVVASLFLGTNTNDPSDAPGEGLLALDGPAEPLADAPPIDPLPPADDPDTGLDLGLDLDPIGPPQRGGLDNPADASPPTRLTYADEPVVELPVGSEPRASMTVGRPAFADDDPFNRAAFEPLDQPITPPEPQPITIDEPTADLESIEPAESAEPAEANAGIALGPIDPVTRDAPEDTAANAELVLPPPAVPILRLYTIESGDSLSSVALATYGSASKWVDIAQANPLVDPNRLRVGQEIKLPDLDGVGPDPATTETVEAGDDLPRRGATYVVKSGDNLSNIAKQFYNSSAKWELIYQANRSKIGDDPGNLKLGMELLIPPPDRGAN
ncbi:MAG: LysM peptidoglycan-binding domain-containing protein [Planctomycetota bacterium]